MGVPDFAPTAESRFLPPPFGVESHLMTFPVAARSLATGYSLQALRAESQGTLSNLFKRGARIPHPEWGCQKIAGGKPAPPPEPRSL